MKTALDTLLTAPYVKIGDELEGQRCLGRPPQLTDSEFSYLPKQPGGDKRLRAALPLVKKAIRMLAIDTD
ncbi:hypothetical protein WJ438_12090 [Streptomyces sp. GD-15H]|uniref:hypothetical protein n=1 Tax=Streptomyces sp. GD-15H TaxID=3129112 RepID=UPI0032441F31